MRSGTAIEKQIKDVIRLEANAVLALDNAVSPAWTDAVNMILTASGKVILTGMGKSGLIAQKIASTMSSTGTVAIFMHPAEGMHGDLGVVAKGDVVIALSKSGESDELSGILPGLKKRGAKIISITAEIRSKLAQASDVVLHTPIEREACPLNLAPTSSTTASLVVGDALAMAVMQEKGIKADDFAVNHPGGKLGRRLLLSVRDVMVPKDRCPVLHPDKASMEEVLLALGQYSLGVVLLSRDQSTLAGILTDGDVRRLLSSHRLDFFKLSVAQEMNAHPVQIDADKNAYLALEAMESRPKPLNLLVATSNNLSPTGNLPARDPSNVIAGVVRLHDLVGVK